MTKELKLPASAEQLDKVLTSISTDLESCGCPSKICHMVMVAAEEIFVNIVSYAYPSGEGFAVVRYDVDAEQHVVTVAFIDHGVEYNPLAKEDPDVTLSASERPIGGLGIYLVKKTMDEVTYKREDDSNVLTIVKYF